MGCNESKQASAAATGNTIPRRSFRKKLGIVKPKDSDPISSNNAHIVTRNPSARDQPTTNTNDVKDVSVNTAPKEDAQSDQKTKKVDKEKVEDTGPVNVDVVKEDQEKPRISSTTNVVDDAASSVYFSPNHSSVKDGDSKDDGESKEGGDDDDDKVTEEKSLVADGKAEVGGATSAVVDEEKIKVTDHDVLKERDEKDADLKKDGEPNPEEDKIEEKSMANKEEVTSMIDGESGLIKVSHEDEKVCVDADDKYFSPYQGTPTDVHSNVGEQEADGEKIGERSLDNKGEVSSLVDKDNGITKVSEEDEKGEGYGSPHRGVIKDVDLKDDGEIKEVKNDEKMEENVSYLEDDDKTKEVKIDQKTNDESLTNLEEIPSSVDEDNKMITTSHENDKEKHGEMTNSDTVEEDGAITVETPISTTTTKITENLAETKVSPSDSPRKEIDINQS